MVATVYCVSTAEISRSGDVRPAHFYRFQAICPFTQLGHQTLWMISVRTLDKLWIEFVFTPAENFIHRNSPSFRATYTGGFDRVLFNKFNNLVYFYMKSGSTNTTKL